jgi:predicted RNA-binding protein YlxR (DUF448 family)
MRPKHIPQRTCVSCRTTGEKRGLLRVVRQPDGTVLFDPTGKRSGRGAYVCASMTCIALAEKQRRLARSLQAEISTKVFEELRARAAQEQASDSPNTDE